MHYQGILTIISTEFKGHIIRERYNFKYEYIWSASQKKFQNFMNDKTNNYFLQAAAQKEMNPEELMRLADRGSRIAFKTGIDKMIELSEQEGFSYEEILELISTCADGGILEQKLKIDG